MDRRRAVALILGLVLCLALLGRWIVRFDEDEVVPAEPPTATHPPIGATGAIIPVPPEDSKAGGTVSQQAPPGPGVFRGRVIDAATSAPIREFTVELQPTPQRKEPAAEIKQSFRTKDGRFIYRGLPSGTWTIFITAASYQRFNMPAARILEDQQPQEILIPMRRGLGLRGRVVDETTNEGIASATISFREASVGRYERNYQLRPSVSSRKDGSFTLDGVPPGAVRLEVRAGGYVRREIDSFVTATTAPVEIALSKGAMLSGYLAGTDGITPVPGEVSLANLDEGRAQQLSTGPAGEFTFFRLSPGRHRLTGRGRGLNGEREVVLAHDEHLEGIVLPMTASHSLRGVISGLRPDERTQAIILVGAQGRNMNLIPQASPNERGAYEISSIPPGRIWIQVVTPRRGHITKEAEMPANDNLTVDFEFQPGARLTGRVTRAGEPLGEAMVVVSAAAANTQFQLGTVSSTNGDYAIEDVPNGEYSLSVDWYDSPPVRVAGDTVFDVDVPDAQLSGRLLQEGGKVPVVGALVDLRAEKRGIDRAGARSDHFGQFSVSGLQPGDFVLSVYKPGFELYRVPFSYSSPVKDMVINMRPARGVEIRVRDTESNKPVGTIVVMELVNGMHGLILQLQADQNGVSYLPSGLSGSSLRIMASSYAPADVMDWNGEPLDVALQRPSR
jgi:hypothetical protein